MSSSQHTPVPINVHLRGEQSDGQLAVIDMVIGADNGGPPLHVHPAHAEGFYVLEGELAVQVGDETVMARARSFHFAPAGTPHTFANFSGAAARILVLLSPAGFEPYFDRLAAGEPAVPPPEQAIAVGPQISPSRGRGF
jgi:mannose-6-phosphate isomerase-like protein (cupin superfamily)